MSDNEQQNEQQNTNEDNASAEDDKDKNINNNSENNQNKETEISRMERSIITSGTSRYDVNHKGKMVEKIDWN